MAKAKSKKKVPPARTPDAPADQLRPALDAFDRGAYHEARPLLATRAEASDASDSERRMARMFIAATGFEKGTLLAGLACLGLYGLVVLVALAKQP